MPWLVSALRCDEDLSTPVETVPRAFHLFVADGVLGPKNTEDSEVWNGAEEGNCTKWERNKAKLADFLSPSVSASLEMQSVTVSCGLNFSSTWRPLIRRTVVTACLCLRKAWSSALVVACVKSKPETLPCALLFSQSCKEIWPIIAKSNIPNVVIFQIPWCH